VSFKEDVPEKETTYSSNVFLKNHDHEESLNQRENFYIGSPYMPMQQRPKETKNTFNAT